MSLLRKIDLRLRAPLLVLCVAACVDQGELFGPEPIGPDAPRVRLTESSYVLYEGDLVSVRLQGWDAAVGGAVEVMVLGTDRQVLWRSPGVPATDTLIQIPVQDVPPALFEVDDLLLTAALELREGRVYASDDTIAVFTRDSAAVRSVKFYPGEVVALSAGSPQSFALDPASGRLYFAAGDRAQIGVISLAEARELQGLDVPTGPIDLRFTAGMLGALVAEGTELAVYDAREGLEAQGRSLLPTLRLEIETAGADDGTEVDTLRAAVRPYGRGIGWSCRDAACDGAVAFIASGISGTEAGEGTGVMRRVAVGAGDQVTPLVIPRFQKGLTPGDTIESRVRLWSAAETGADSAVFNAADRVRCGTLALGGTAFDLGPTGILYVATSGGCGDGTRILRVDSAVSDNPRINALAQRNLAGEDRIGAATELRVSPDGRFVLVRTDDQVHVLDADLRLRGSVPVTGPTAIAWVEAITSSLFAVASDDGVAVYDSDRRAIVARFPLGPTRERLLVVWRHGAELIAAAAPRDRSGVVAARVPYP